MSDDESREQPEVEQSFFHQQQARAQRCHDLGIDLAYSQPPKIDRALEELDKAIRLRESIFGKYHNDTCLSYFRKACLLRDKKEHNQALVVARRELRITHRLMGGYLSENPVVATDSEQWWIVERVQWIQEVLLSEQGDVSKRQVSSYTSGLLSAMECERLGDLHFVAGEYDHALKRYDSALGLEVSAPSHCPIEIADLQVKIGDCFAGMKDYDAALQEYSHAERRYIESLGSSFRVLGQLYQSIGEIFLKQHKFDDALRSYSKAYTAFEWAVGKKHKLSVEILQDIRLVTVREMEELRKMERSRKKNKCKRHTGSSLGSTQERSVSPSLGYSLSTLSSV